MQIRPEPVKKKLCYFQTRLVQAKYIRNAVFLYWNINHCGWYKKIYKCSSAKKKKRSIWAAAKYLAIFLPTSNNERNDIISNVQTFVCLNWLRYGPCAIFLRTRRSQIQLTRGMAFPPSTSTFLNLSSSQEGFRILIVLSSVAISLSQSFLQELQTVVMVVKSCTDIN